TLALLDQLEVARVILVGYDIGSVVAQAIARQQPARVVGLVLLNPSHPGIGVRRYEPTMQREFWYQDFHRLPWSDQLITGSQDGVRLYLQHFFDHWAAHAEAFNPQELEAIFATYAQPGALRRSFAWYRSRLKDRARLALLPPEQLRVHQ